MLSAAPKPVASLASPFLSHHPIPPPIRHSLRSLTSPNQPSPKPISALILPPEFPQQQQQQKQHQHQRQQQQYFQQQQQQLYQPFRLPPSPIPSKFRSLDTNGQLDVLTNRLGLWFEYAPLIPSLTREGFTPSIVEEITGIPGVLQNTLVVGSMVRQSLVECDVDPEILSFFDTGGAEILYEIRLLSATQRVDAVRFLIENNFDAKGARELARAIKDYPRRRGDKGWECFSYTLPGDCLAYMYYRQALEHVNDVETWKDGLQKALEVVESEVGKKQIKEELEGKDEGEKAAGVDDGVRVPVVRMKIGEVAAASTVIVYPVCNAEERGKDMVEAPWECEGRGKFGVVETEKGWSRWVVLPRWSPLIGLRRGGVVVAFPDARVLPWRVNRWYKEEAILVVADRGRTEVVADDGFYLVVGGGGNGGGNGGGGDRLRVERGNSLMEMGVKESLGTVVIVVRPPREESDDQLSDEEWE